MVPDNTGGLALRDYVAVVWRRKWGAVAVLAAVTAVAYMLAWRQTPQYSAAATLIYERSIDVANPLTGQSYTDPNERNLELQSVSDVMASPDMQQRAAVLLAERGAPTAGYSVNSSTSGGTQNNAYRNTVVIEAISADQKLAAAAANAFADAYVAWRKEQMEKQIGEAIDAVERKVRGYKGVGKRSADYVILQQRLSDLEILKATATGNYRVLTPASVPSKPFAPRPLRSAVLGFGVGLFVAIGLVFVLEQFDTRLREPDDVAAVMQRPILARIPTIPRRELSEDRLVCLAHPGGHSAEAFRLLRTNLEFMSVDQNVRSLAMTSCLQGEGKSVAIANLAVAMAIAGKRVVVVDGDLRRPQIHDLFSLSNDAGVSTVVTAQTPLTSALQAFGPSVGAEAALVLRGPDGNGSPNVDVDGVLDLRVLTSGPLPPNPGEIVSSQVFGDVISRLERDADIVLVDSPAMLAVGDAVALCSRVSGFLFLVQLKATRRPQLERAAEQISRLPSPLLGIVLARGKEHAGGYYYYYGYTRDASRERTTSSARTPTA